MALKLYNLFSFWIIKTTLCRRIGEACVYMFVHQKELWISIQSVYGFDVANDVDLFPFYFVECSANMLPFSQKISYR